MRCVRIWFKKTGRVKYVSHLDIMRCMTRAVRRAGIPLWYTEGYNPHPYLNFLQPMPLGIEGMNEPFDIRLENDISNEEIKKRMNSVLPEGIDVTRVAEPYMKSSDIAFAEYDIYFEKEENTAEKLEYSLASGELVCEKTGKVGGRKKIKTVNVSENIKSYCVSEDGEAVKVNIVFPCSNEKNVNPNNFLAAVNGLLKTDYVPLNIVRLGLFDKNMSPFE